MLYNFGRWVYRSLVKLHFYGLIVSGMEMIPESGAVILAANHSGPIDPPLLSLITMRKIRFMAKSMTKLEDFLWSLVSAFPVRKGKPDRRALKSALRILTREEVVGMMVIGHSQKHDPDALPQRGASVIASQCDQNVLIVPIGVYWQDNSEMPACISIVCGEPLESANYKHDSSGELLNQELGMRIAAARRLAVQQIKNV